ncbi:hypothetical protein EDB84DRAFT_1590195 [Lactarius hengduanensis]|nr:hypothetical protein EDB84DRAFT_1590195 [Lactarius hengduanensis]
MSSIIVRCRGCDRAFTPTGLSKHINRTRGADCRSQGRFPHASVPARSQSQPTLNTAPSSSTPLNQNAESWDTTDIPASRDEHYSRSTDGPFQVVVDQPVYESSPPTGSHASDDAPLVIQTDSEISSNVVVERFPHGHPGAPVTSTPEGASIYESTQQVLGESLWAPFQSQCDWEIARWAKMHGPTSSAVTGLLAIPGLVDILGLSYKTSQELNNIIDKKLPGPPQFRCQELNIGGECLQFHHRDIIQCIRTLFGNPEFAHDLVFAPERHYTDSTQTCHIYDEMYTGDWWCNPRRPLKHIVPARRLSRSPSSAGKTAYPVYMTIGNIPKDIRRKPSRSAQMLLGYIPTSKLEGITNRAARRRALANMFHSCMEMILDPIRLPGEIGLAMMSGDGTWRRCHPVFATFVGDYPEQTLVTCTFNGRCPKCLVPPDELGKYSRFPPRDHVGAIDTYRLADEDIGSFHAACRSAGLKPVYHPFWHSLPLTDVFLSITPDVLHQLLQGVMKHLVSWLTNPAVFGPVAINMRCQLVPPHHHITLFAKGITTLSRVTGKEHKDMCRILIGLIADLPLRVGNYQHALLGPLTRFHDNKDVFLDLGVRNHFKIPKLHSLLHYKASITLFGTTDNYNTEQSERLHIDFAKDAYRATNRKDEYTQMTGWLQRREKILLHMAYVKWRQQSSNTTTQIPVPLGPLQARVRYPKMARHPSIKAVSFDALAERYSAVDFQDALADYIAQVNHPGASAATLRARAADTLLPFHTIPVFHRIKFTAGNFDDSEIVDSVVVRPEQNDTHGRVVPSRFDTVLVRGTRQDIHGNNGHRIAQLRVVFQLPKKVISDLFPFPDTSIPTHFAYVEWFSTLSATRDVKNLIGRRRAAVIPVQSIIGSVHLLPRFGPITPPDWNCFTVLDHCSSFYVNPFSDRHNFLIFS